MDTLHDRLGDEVADVVADLDLLTTAARRRGLAQRRQRRALTAVGAATAVAVVALGGWALLPPSADRATEGVTATSSPDSETTGAPAPTAGPETRLTGRSTAAVLLDLLPTTPTPTVAPGSVRGSGGVPLADERGEVVITADANEETYAEASLTTPTGRSLVTVNVQRADVAVPWPATGCPTWAQDCATTDLGVGNLLRTYRDDTDKPGTVRVVAELVSTDRDLRVVVATSTPAGETPALDDADLRAVASSPVWSRRVPDTYAGAGLRFTSLEEGSLLHPVDP